MLAASLHGFALALALILPLGPQNMFVLTQGSQGKLKQVLPTILTAALSDSLMIFAAVAGVAAIVEHYSALRMGLAIAGGVFLIWMGYKSWMRAPALTSEAKTMGAAVQIRQSLSVSLLNPHAVMDTVIILGGGSSLYVHADERWAYALAAASVSWMWFFFLAAGGAVLSRWSGRKTGRLLGRSSALLMWLIAARTLWQVIENIGGI
jgi:L-lysine exporter family protein LysE/ArgO